MAGFTGHLIPLCTSPFSLSSQIRTSTWMTCACDVALKLTSSGNRGRSVMGVQKSWRPPCSWTGYRKYWSSNFCGFIVCILSFIPVSGFLILYQLRTTLFCTLSDNIRQSFLINLRFWQNCACDTIISVSSSSGASILSRYNLQPCFPWMCFWAVYSPCDGIIFVAEEWIDVLCTVVFLWDSLSFRRRRPCGRKLYRRAVYGLNSLRFIVFATASFLWRENFVVLFFCSQATGGRDKNQRSAERYVPLVLNSFLLGFIRISALYKDFCCVFANVRRSCELSILSNTFCRLRTVVLASTCFRCFFLRGF